MHSLRSTVPVLTSTCKYRATSSPNQPLLTGCLCPSFVLVVVAAVVVVSGPWPYLRVPDHQTTSPATPHSPSSPSISPSLSPSFPVPSAHTACARVTFLLVTIHSHLSGLDHFRCNLITPPGLRQPSYSKAHSSHPAITCNQLTTHTSKTRPYNLHPPLQTYFRTRSLPPSPSVTIPPQTRKRKAAEATLLSTQGIRPNKRISASAAKQVHASPPTPLTTVSTTMDSDDDMLSNPSSDDDLLQDDSDNNSDGQLSLCLIRPSSHNIPIPKSQLAAVCVCINP